VTTTVCLIFSSPLFNPPNPERLAGKDREPNWLPAPNGPIYLVMRVYWPNESALNGTWKPQAVQRVK
jgi:hypothetical protein